MTNYDTDAVRKFQEQVARGTPSITMRSKDDIFSSEPRRAKKTMKTTKAKSLTVATQFATNGTITVSHTATTITQVETDVRHLRECVESAVLDALPQIASNSATKTVTTPLPTVPMQEKPIEMRVFTNRMDTIGVEETVALSEFFTKLQTPTVTSETMDAYTSLSKEQQNNLKDKGLYLLGVTNGAGKSEADIIHRTAGAIDIDEGTDEYTKETLLQALRGVEFVYHTTRKSRLQAPRYRIIVPFSAPVTAQEYPIIMQYLANHLQGYGIHVDESCTRVTQGMFFPTISSDQHIHYGKHIDHVTHYEEAPNTDANLGLYTPPTKHSCGLLDVKDILNRYTPPTKAAPLSQKTQKSVPPRERKGFEGIFNRAYDPHEGIQTFLPHVYEFDEKSGRYLHRNSTSGEAGLIVNPDETIHSMHGACDAFGGKTGSLYQLVLLHMFAGDAHAMQEHFNTDERIRKALEQEHGEGEAWKAQLKRTENGTIKNTGANLEIIAKHDTRFRDNLRFNMRNGFTEVSGTLPWNRKHADKFWSDYDTIKLSCELEKTYGITAKAAAEEFVYHLQEFNAYEPLQEYMAVAATLWDGKPRVRDLFIKLLGAEDNNSIRAFTELFFRAGVARTFDAGCKFDEMIILMGEQGAGKSMLLKKLAIQSEFHTDSLTTFTGDESYMKIRNAFIVEVGELTALRKSDEEAAKQFISATHDTYRTKFEKHATPKARRCVFAGTTNKSVFLRDPTGNRRFLPIKCSNEKADNYKVYAVTDEEVQQIWGEAVHLYRKNPQLVLPPKAHAHAMELQKEHAQLPEGISEFEAWLEEKSVNFVTEKNLYENWLKVDEIGKRTSNNDKLVREALAYVKHALRWDYVRETENGVRKRGYRRPKA